MTYGVWRMSKLNDTTHVCPHHRLALFPGNGHKGLMPVAKLPQRPETMLFRKKFILLETVMTPRGNAP